MFSRSSPSFPSLTPGPPRTGVSLKTSPMLPAMMLYVSSAFEPASSSVALKVNVTVWLCSLNSTLWNPVSSNTGMLSLMSNSLTTTLAVAVWTVVEELCLSSAVTMNVML